MNYYTLLGLNKEPFSNSPDPEMFFRSSQHQSCLQKLELSIRLKRGLSVVIGDIGTGKSTLCRQLLRMINTPKDSINANLILDPEFTSPLEFLTSISKIFGISAPTTSKSEWQLKDDIKNYIFHKTVEKSDIEVLIIDEGQKLPGFCIEILREFLNFETNKHKLLQIVIFAQPEFKAILKDKANFADRITALQPLAPLSFADTRKMIGYRLQQAREGSTKVPNLFSFLATLAIYFITKGYPRKIVMLCSKTIFTMLIKNKNRASLFDVLASAKETSMASSSRIYRAIAYASIAIFFIVIGATTEVGSYIKTLHSPPTISLSSLEKLKSMVSQIKPAAGVHSIETQTTVAKTPPIPLEKSFATDIAQHPIGANTTENPPFPYDFSEDAYSKLPGTLGTIEYDAETSLSKMIARIYGRYTQKRLSRVLRNNPHIHNPDKIQKSTLIHFPKKPNQQFRISPGSYWVELTSVSSLAQAYNIVKKIPDSAPSTLIVPTTGTNSEMIFVIVVENSFFDPESAKGAVQKFTETFKDKSIIRKG